MEIPLATVNLLWGKTGKLDELDTEELCDRLNRLSLLLQFDLTMRRIRLHDVVWKYLVREQSANLAWLNNCLLDAHRPSSDDWADLAAGEPYFWDYLAYHLSEAERVEELVTTIKDLRYVTAKTFARGVSTVETDLFFAETKAPHEATLRLLRRSFVQCAHLPNRCESLKDLRAALYSRLQHLEQLTPLTLGFAQSLSLPYLTVWQFGIHCRIYQIQRWCVPSPGIRIR